MKRNILSLMVAVSFIGTTSLFAANQTEKVKVKGNCGSCENRIETAAKSVKGVSFAKWDQETKIMEVTFDDEVTDIKKIETAIAKAGHDTPLYKANDDTYNNLPGCCKYERTNSKTK